MMPDMSPLWILGLLVIQTPLAFVLGMRMARRTERDARGEYGQIVEQVQRAILLALDKRRASEYPATAFDLRRPELVEPADALDSRDAQEGTKAEGKTLMAEVSGLIEANQNLQQQLETARRKIRKQAKKLSQYRVESRTDQLTRALNRHGLDEELAYLISMAQRYGEPFGLVMLELSAFKRFNEVNGHSAGDTLLKGVAQTLSETMRETDIVARYAGDEFMVVLPRCDASSAGMAAKRVCKVLQSASIDCGRSGRVTPAVNVGITVYVPDDSAESMIRRAEAAMFRAKAKGQTHLHDGHNIIDLEESQATLTPAACQQ